MQKQRDILELCFNELTHDRNTLRNLSSMAPRTFQRNMKKLENGERLGRKVGSGRPRKFSDSERQKICEFARSNPLSSSSKLSQIVAQVNPIENVWEILKNAVEQKNPKTKQELIEAIQNSKSVITREIRENLMNSVGKRLKSCKRLQGELI